jgi:hypothetical protein
VEDVRAAQGQRGLGFRGELASALLARERRQERTFLVVRADANIGRHEQPAAEDVLDGRLSCAGLYEKR